MQKIAQYRRNVSSSYNNLDSSKKSNIISISNGKILRIGAQGTPGTKIALNSKDNQAIIIGASGIYELDLSSQFSYVTSLKVTFIDDDLAPFILDIVYEV